MDQLTVFETEHWEVSHRIDSRYPGYLLASSKTNESEIYNLSSESLRELGSVLSKTEILLRKHFDPHKVIMAKLGFSENTRCHFHLIPATLELIEEIGAHPKYTNEPDGNDTILYTNREYCERNLSVDEQRTLINIVEQLRKNS